MAKKQTGKVIQMLSPENYIRTKARTLPIYECLVNNGWSKEGIANIIISRKHTNGNVTVCLYLVDLFCLGVKDTHYIFNISMEEYQDVVSESQYTEPITISYDLAHSIIYEALEFAEDFGFKPHKDFTSTTQFMLEEDNDDIEFFDIECGKNGKPLYLSEPNDNQQKINSVIKQLEKTAGIGNFKYYSAEFYDEFNQDEEEDEEVEDDEFKDWTFEEKKKLFLDYINRIAKLKEDEIKQMFQIGNSIIKDTINAELYHKYYSEYSDDLNINLIDDIIPDGMLGIYPGSILISNEAQELFETIFFDGLEKPRLGLKLLEKFKKLTPDIPASYFLELKLLSVKNSFKYIERLNEYSEKFPDYSLIRLLQLVEELKLKKDTTPYLNQNYSCYSIFHGRDELHTIEMVQYITFHLLIISQLDDVSRVIAFIQACDELNFQEQDLTAVTMILEFSKINVVHNYLTR
jgi:hypothetical protein